MNKDIKIRDYLVDIISKTSDKEKLPSENEIAQNFNVSRHKVRSIYDSLEDMGLVYSIQGVGRFALVDLPEISLALNSDSFTGKMLADGVDLLTKNLGTTRLGPEESTYYRDLGLKGNIYKISRLRILYGQPAVIHSSYLGDATFPKIESEGSSIKSIHSYYQAKGLEIEDTGNRTIAVKFPKKEEIEIFQCGPLVPLLNVKTSVVKAGTRDLVEVTDVIYRSDIFTYKL